MRVVEDLEIEHLETVREKDSSINDMVNRIVKLQKDEINDKKKLDRQEKIISDLRGVIMDMRDKVSEKEEGIKKLVVDLEHVKQQNSLLSQRFGSSQEANQEKPVNQPNLYIEEQDPKRHPSNFSVEFKPLTDNRESQGSNAPDFNFVRITETPKAIDSKRNRLKISIKKRDKRIFQSHVEDDFNMEQGLGLDIDANIDVKEVTTLMNSGEDKDAEKDPIHNSRVDERSRTLDASDMNYALSSKLYSGSTPINMSRTKDFNIKEPTKSQKENTSEERRRMLETVVPRQIDTVDNTASNTGRNTIISLPQIDISDNKIREMMAELLVLKSENSHLKVQRERQNQLIRRLSGDDVTMNPIEQEPEPLPENNFENESDLWGGLGDETDNYNGQEIDLENLEEVQPKMMSSEVFDIGSNLSQILLKKVEEQKGIEITPELQKKAQDFISKSIRIEVTVPEEEQNNQGDEEGDPKEPPRTIITASFNFPNENGEEVQDKLSIVRETRREETSQGEEENLTVTNPSGIDEQDPKSKALLTKLYKGFEKVMERPTGRGRLDTPDFTHNLSFQTRLRNSIAKDKANIGDDSDVPNSNSARLRDRTFNSEPPTDRSEGENTKKTKEHIQNLENIARLIKSEIHYFKHHVTDDDIVDNKEGLVKAEDGSDIVKVQDDEEEEKNEAEEEQKQDYDNIVASFGEV